MFKLCSYIIEIHPEMLEITSQKETKLESFSSKEVKNTNAVLYNIPEVTGLKTGTTNKAGACLVTSLKMKIDGEEHHIVSVLLGAETGQDRVRVSEMLIRYGREVLKGTVPSYVGDVEKTGDDGLPTSAEGIIELLINGARDAA